MQIPYRIHQAPKPAIAEFRVTFPVPLVGLFNLGFSDRGDFNLKCHTFAALPEQNHRSGEFALR